MADKSTQVSTGGINIVQSIAEQFQNADIAMPDDEDALLKIMVESEIGATLHAVKSGMAAKKLKEMMGHGSFKQKLSELGLEYRSIRQKMSLAEFFISVPDEKVKTFSLFKPSQLLEVARLPDERIAKMRTEELEELGSLSVRALRQTVKQMNLELEEQTAEQQEIASLRQRNQQLEQERADAINMLNSEQLKKAPETRYGLNAEVAHIRQQALVIGEQLAACASELRHEVDRCTRSALASEHQSEGAMAIYWALFGPMTEIFGQMQALQEAHPHVFSEVAQAIPLFSPEEIQEALSRANSLRSPLLQQMQHDRKKGQKS